MASRFSRRFSGSGSRVARLMVAATMALASTACVKVAPYERGMLAHPTMSADDMSNAMDGHVREVSEGASGGLGGGGGGCGCI